MKISQKGIKLIQDFEGLALKAYKDPIGVWTWGYGSTGPHVTPDKVGTKEEAEQLLKKDLERFEKGVSDLIKVPLNQNQFDSLVSFSFNLGLGNLKSSTLLKKLNASDYQGASNEILRWNRAGGKVLAGLTRRRIAERDLFLS
nr:MAG TPA: Lysozyme [Caudoviricetes sp.]